jgi:hypothetical protein
MCAGEQYIFATVPASCAGGFEVTLHCPASFGTYLVLLAQGQLLLQEHLPQHLQPLLCSQLPLLLRLAPQLLLTQLLPCWPC